MAESVATKDPSDPTAVGSEGALPVVMEATGLTKHFPVRRKGRAALTGTRRAIQAVDDVTFTRRRGRVTAWVGESGVGKATVARLLAGLYPRTGGDSRLHEDAVNIKRGKAFRAYARRVQMIFQDPFAS